MDSCLTELFERELTICIKMDLALNNLRRLISHKTQSTNQPSLFARPLDVRSKGTNNNCYHLHHFTAFSTLWQNPCIYISFHFISFLLLIHFYCVRHSNSEIHLMTSSFLLVNYKWVLSSGQDRVTSSHFKIPGYHFPRRILLCAFTIY